MEKEYAQAVIQVAEKGMQAKELVKNLEGTLRAHGHVALMPKIARALREELKRKERRSASILSVAKEEGVVSAKEEAAKYIGRTPVHVVTDDSLIGGWVLSTPNTRVDASFKKQLLDLYRKITA